MIWIICFNTGYELFGLKFLLVWNIYLCERERVRVCLHCSANVCWLQKLAEPLRQIDDHVQLQSWELCFHSIGYNNTLLICIHREIVCSNFLYIRKPTLNYYMKGYVLFGLIYILEWNIYLCESKRVCLHGSANLC